MTTEVRIVTGDEAKTTAASAALDPITFAYLPPKAYPTGVITLNALSTKLANTRSLSR
jgi:hypothetical protein